MRNTATRILLVLTAALATGGAQGQPPSGKIGLIYPLVPGHGGVAAVKIAAVLHGEADNAVSSDAAYLARFKGAPDPKLPWIGVLKEAGVELFVCGQSLHGSGVQGGGGGVRGSGR